MFSSYLDDQYTEADLNEILKAFDTEEPERGLDDQIRIELEASREPDAAVLQMMDRVEQRLLLSIKKEHVPVKKVRSLLPWFSGAAAAVLLIGFAWWHWSGNFNTRIVKDNVYGYANDVLPGGNKATLILSDGRSVELDKDKTALREKDGTEISGKDGLLVYKGSTVNVGEKILMNTLVVPKGGSYELSLPDGSRVWVNASSVLRFPTHFSGTERKVFVEGEAYFKIAKNADMPFRVHIGKATVQALGTQFNVNSTDPKGIRATLAEGSILVSSLDKFVKLVPGQEAVLSAPGTDFVVRKADMEQVLAWKDGYFYFKNDRFEQMMNEVANWYGLKLQYEGTIPQSLYTGSVDRNAKLSEVLEMLKSISPAKFRIDGQKLIIDFN